MQDAVAMFEFVQRKTLSFWSVKVGQEELTRHHPDEVAGCLHRRVETHVAHLDQRLHHQIQRNRATFSHPNVTIASSVHEKFETPA